MGHIRKCILNKENKSGVFNMEENSKFIENKETLKHLSGVEINAIVQTPSDQYDLRGLSEDEMAEKIASVIIKDIELDIKLKHVKGEKNGK